MVKRISWTYFSYLYETDGNINAQNWDFVLTHWKNWSGMVHVVWKTTEVVDGQNVLSLATTREPVIALKNDKNILVDVKYKIFRDYWQTFHFVTADGIVHWHYDEWTPSSFEYTFNGDTEFNTNNLSNTPAFYVQSFDNYDESIAFLWTNGTLFLWKRGYNKFFFSASDTVQTNWMFTDIQELLWQIVLIGPDRMWYFVHDFNTWASSLTDLTKVNGHFSRRSYLINDEKFFFIRKTKDLYTMEVQFAYWNSKPAVVFQYLNNFLNTDLEMLDPTVNKVTMAMVKNNINIFINDGTGNTKLLYFNRYYNLWSKRLITWCEIHTVKDGIYLGKGIFENSWDTDDGNDITQIITMTFWDKTHSATKRISFVKLPIWYNSYFEKGNSWFSSAVDNWWWHYETVYDDFGRTDYATNVMKIQLDNITPSNITTKIKEYPVEIEMRAAKWVNYERDVANTYQEFQEYLNYTKPWSDWNEETTFSVSKFWVIKVPLSQIWEVFTFEIVARWKTKLEFGWFFIWFQYLDNDYWRYEDTLTCWELTTDSWKTFTKHTQPYPEIN